MEHVDDVRRRLVVGGHRYSIVTATHGPTTLVEVDGVAHRVSRDEGGVLRSPAPALVVATPGEPWATRSRPVPRSSCSSR